jgi:hypothetical protein
MPLLPLKRQQALIQVVIMASIVGIAWIIMFGYVAVLNGVLRLALNPPYYVPF